MNLKRVGLLLVILVICVGCRQSAQPTPTPGADAIQIDLEYETPVVGDAVLIVTLKNPDGTPYTEAQKVEVRGDMTHAGMVPEFGTGESAPDAEGRYLVPFKWSMAGDWIVTVTVTLADGGTMSKDFEMSVES